MTTTTVVLNVSGMHCGTCAMTISALLKSKDGVRKVFVDYDARKAEVEFDQGKITVLEIIKAVEEADLGYHLSEV
ncbi:hypothetical protein A3D23_03550 [candidate division WOR-1 bacterium RIFCSPHIGHO2_02_FULL_53_26]|nr:MAG: hypothetical protein A3D23_03550 [candidate division WOR-1 bacterium RIFCSPHIGHO2_02_FULL_53_26]